MLRLLPTHLSFREMGADLHVTANTVKTHAHAVYRKLDASSRSEAVVHAREIGLLSTISHLDGNMARRRAILRGALRRRAGGRREARRADVLRRRRASRAGRVFAAPTWLRDLGVLSWLLVGVAALLVAAVALLALTDTIVIPVVTATIVAAVLLAAGPAPRSAHAARGGGRARVRRAPRRRRRHRVLVLGGIVEPGAAPRGDLQKASPSSRTR